MQQGEHELNKLIQLAQRLKSDLPRSKYEQLQRTIEQRQEHLQGLMKTCQQARGEHEHLIKTQNKLNEELIAINEWFKRLLQELIQPLDLNATLNNVNDVQESMAVSLFSLRKSVEKFLFRSNWMHRSINDYHDWIKHFEMNRI